MSHPAPLLTRLPGHLLTGLLASVFLQLCCVSPAAAEPQVPTRAGIDYLEIRQPDGSYEPIFVRGMSFSAALPGKHPSEFPHDEQLFRDWLKLIADMNCNVIRVYTILPPEVYKALLYHNTTYPDKTVWLIQGCWITPPYDPDYDFWGETFNAECEMNSRRAVDLVHGNANFDDRPGWTGGRYTADVSPWLLAWLWGREWEPDDIENFHAISDRTTYQGRYISAIDKQPIDCWLAKMCDYAVSYEVDQYNTQHPITYSSWPVTDPMEHVSESRLALSSIEQEGRVDIFSSDTIQMTVKDFTASPDYKAGLYASYHIYPYWPDFLDNEVEYSQARDRFGTSNYYGYITHLKEHYGTMPLLIAEYGLPNGPMPAHKQKQGLHHGGHSEEEVIEGMERLTYDIYDSGCAGAIIFAWIDEWFKKTWVWADFYDPWDDRRLWYNPYDPEENYGMVALLPGEGGPNCTLSGNADEWTDVPELPGESVPIASNAPVISSVQATHDEGWFTLRIAIDNFQDWEFRDTELSIGYDVLDRSAGNFAWPGPLKFVSDTGLETVVQLKSGKAYMYQCETWRYWRPFNDDVSKSVSLAEAKPHYLQMEENRWSWFEPWVETNIYRIGRDGTFFPSQSFKLNPLPRGSLIAGDPHYSQQAVWNSSPESGVVEIRMPWILLGFVGPHQRRVLQSDPDDPSKNSSAVTDGIGIGLALTSSRGEQLAVWPGMDVYDYDDPEAELSSQFDGWNRILTSRSGIYSWEEWGTEDILYHSRLKPIYYAMRDIFGGITDIRPLFLDGPQRQPVPEGTPMNTEPALEKPLEIDSAAVLKGRD
ncbi:MAG: hypothetical protein R3F46_01895 [bacterium]